MKLNLKFYKGIDEYSDGDVEDRIIDFIKKYPDNYEQAFYEDCSWPVFYHLSKIRKNSISWYPFKKNSTILEVGGGMGAITSELCRKCSKVTTIELSKRRATAILERNKKAKNLEIIVGNFKDIALNEKYDYILLNGVLEYGALYMDSDNPYEDFINKLKKNLKKNGKILIAIENRFGLKYWCGANEDHTGKMFDGIKGYQKSEKIRTFGKSELEKLAKNCNMNINFYYMFPDYKFPKIIYTDESLNKGVYSEYIPYYSSNMNLLLNEQYIYNNIYENGMIPFFANSYFLELSVDKVEKEIEFVKFNNEFRKDKYDLYTYLSRDTFYKACGTKSAIEHMNNIYNIHKLFSDIEIAHVTKKDNCIYTPKIDGINLNKYMKELYEKGNLDQIYEIYDSIYKLIDKNSEKIDLDVNNNIFSKYNIQVEKEKIEKMTFYSKGLIDIIPSNIIYKDNRYILIDQEWIEYNTPLEYIMYRSIDNFFANIEDIYNIKEKLFSKYNIDKDIFSKLDIKFLNNVKDNSFKYYYNYFLNHKIVVNPNEYLIDVSLYEQNNKLKDLMGCLEVENNQLKDTVDNINTENNQLKNLMNSISDKNEKLNSSVNNTINENSQLKKIIHNYETENSKLKKIINDYKIEKNEIEMTLEKISNNKDKLEKTLSSIYNSTSWKIVENLHKIKNRILFFIKK